MLRISRMTDYAILLLSHMAKGEAGRIHAASDLAQGTDIPPPTVSKVLKTLTRAGLLESHRGVAGGYTLARDPRDVNVAEVVAAMEGPIALTMCCEEDGACDVESNCHVQPGIQRINDAIHGALAHMSLHDLTRPPTLFVSIGGRSPDTPAASVAAGTNAHSNPPGYP